MKLSEAQKEIKEAYEKAGWKLEWLYYIDPKQQNCFWHGGVYAIAKRAYIDHEWEMQFCSYGDVCATLYDKDGEEIAWVDDSDNCGDRDEIEDYIHTDKQLEKALESGRLELDDNNWNEMMPYCDGEQVEVSGVVDENDDDVIKSVWYPEELCSFIDENYVGEDGALCL